MTSSSGAATRSYNSRTSKCGSLSLKLSCTLYHHRYTITTVKCRVRMGKQRDERGERGSNFYLFFSVQGAG